LKLEWLPGALADLERFVDFLEKDHPGLAAIIADEITFKTKVLKEQPHIGQKIFGSGDFRRLFLRAGGGTYVVQYRLLGERVIVVRVFHAREERR
jgi:plasmid stabilization system protein ParE